MLAIIQRVRSASVMVIEQKIAHINQGILALICIEASDDNLQFQKMYHKLTGLRIFEDAQKKMNLSLKDIKGGLLLVPQFTLMADTNSGLRPSFSKCCPSQLAQEKFKAFSSYCKQHDASTQIGEFGADMQVTLTNDGPVTLSIKV